jgi:iron complex transport system ATP-binding protein
MIDIVADNLSVHRGPRAVLGGVSLSVGGGECVAVVGPNGAGKTTLLEALIGLLPWSGGGVRVGGRDVRRTPRREIGRQVAYLPQSVDAFGGFAVRDVVRMGRYPHVRPLSPLTGNDEAAVDRAMTACDVTALGERPIHQLSGGERQKVWLAAALAQEAPCLLLDEPTAALDPQHRIELVRTLRGQHERGVTLLMVSHDLDVVAALAGRVVGLRDGGVVCDERTDAFLSAGRLHDVFGCDFDLMTTPSGSPRAAIHV